MSPDFNFRHVEDLESQVGLVDCAEYDTDTPNRWISTLERLPVHGTLIVKKFNNGNVWASVYVDAPKQSSFLEWKAI